MPIELITNHTPPETMAHAPPFAAALAQATAAGVGAPALARAIALRLLASRGWEPAVVADRAPVLQDDGPPAQARLIAACLAPFQFSLDPGALPAEQAPVGPEALEIAAGLLDGRHAGGAFYTAPGLASHLAAAALRRSLVLRCPAAAPALPALFGVPEAPRAYLDPGHALDLYRTLMATRACDPAMGTGACLLALFRHMVTLAIVLIPVLDGYPPFELLIAHGVLVDPRRPFELRRFLASRCLAGCDLDAAAVAVARVRLAFELLTVAARPVPVPRFEMQLVVGEALSALPDWPPRRPGPRRPAVGRMRPCPGGRHAHVRRLITLQRRVELATGAALSGARAALARARARCLARVQGVPEPRALVWELDMAAARGRRGFDIVIGNPPYLRQELIDRGFEALGLHVRKAALRAAYARRLGVAIDGRADLYVYFIIRGLALLRRQDGVLAYLCANSWLDVEFGARLRRYLAAHTRIDAIVEPRTRRSFAAAGINVIILLLSTRVRDEPGALASFCAARDLGAALATLPPTSPGVQPHHAGRWTSVPVADLRGADRAWGAHYLRAPALLATLAAHVAGKLMPLPAIADVYRGVTTGCNAFFLPTAAQAQAAGLPDELLRPALTSMRELQGLVICPETLGHRLLVCPLDPAELAGRGWLAAADYITAGAERLTRAGGRHQRAGIPLARARTQQQRTQWWRLRAQPGGDLVVPRLIRERFAVLLNPAHVCVTDMFFNLAVRAGHDVEVVAALANTTLVYLWIELLGRSNVGGRINLYGPELRQLSIPDPTRFAGRRRAALLDAFAAVRQRPLRPIAAQAHDEAQQALDQVVLSTLGIADLQSAIVAELVGSVAQRTQREQFGPEELS